MSVSPYFDSPEIGDKQYFNIFPEYVADSQLYNSIISEVYNNFGVPMEYYVTTWNTSADKVYGEDNARQFTRRFNFMAFYELPSEMSNWNIYGIDGIDNFFMHCSKVHFAKASTTSGDGLPSTSGIYEEYTPKAGDIVYAKYTKKFYELLSIRDADEVFLQKKHSWTFTVKPMIDQHIIPAPSMSATDIVPFTDQDDIMSITDTVETEISGIEYTPGATEESAQAQDKFSGW
jgi:hypothetical protein